LSELGDLLLTALVNHGSGLLGASLFLAALGLPLPASMLLIAAGAFVRQGILPLHSAALAGLAGAVAGDACSYLLGRFAGHRLPLALTTSAQWQRAAELFARWGSWGIWVTRFLLTPLALPVNLLAGSTRYPWQRFMGVVVLGELMWVLLFGGLGHVFADQWQEMSTLAGDLGGLLLGVALGAFAGLALLRARRRAQGAAARSEDPQAGKKPSTDR
jgi:membrane-associated protein